MQRFLTMAGKLVYERGDYIVYRYCEAAQGPGEPDPDIRVLGAYAEVPETFLPVLFPQPRLNVMAHRLKRRRARLLCYSRDGHRLLAYGWVQLWRPFRRKFAALADNGLMLGPYWTAPDSRGQGLYGKLLRHSLFVSPKDKPILIYTDHENVASQRGIEKAGFQRMGRYRITMWFRLFVRCSAVP